MITTTDNKTVLEKLIERDELRDRLRGILKRHPKLRKSGTAKCGCGCSISFNKQVCLACSTK